jgi:hypothetical protein
MMLHAALLAGAVLAAAPRALPAVLPAADGIREPFFAIMVGLAENELYGVVPGARLRVEIARVGRPSRLPIERITQVRRDPTDTPGHAQVVAGLTGPLDLPVPYSILGYHPGSFRASPWIVLDEWDLGTLRLDVGGGVTAVLENVRVWGVRQGRAEMDVDSWLDRVMGGRLDDTRIVGLAAFQYQGERIGLAMGYNKDGEGRSGAFRFRDDEIIYPNQPAFMAAARYLRRRLELMMPEVRGARP